jgi:hypothetical protein
MNSSQSSTYTVYLVQPVQDPETTARDVAAILKIDAKIIEQRLKRPTGIIGKTRTLEQAQQMQRAFKLAGVRVEISDGDTQEVSAFTPHKVDTVQDNPIQPEDYKQERPNYPRRSKFCPNCGKVGRPKTVTRGSCLIELLLWIFFIVPGIIYSVWRLSSRYQACRFCGYPNLAPIDSPAAQRALYGDD